MALVDLIQNSFASGELSPSMYARTDITKYSSGLRTALNFLIHPQGGASNRCGFKYIENAKYSASLCVAQEFIFNQTQAYILEFGHLYVRFYTDGAQITSGGTAYEVTTPYTASDVAQLRFESSADVIFITHPDYKQRTLTRYDTTNWVLSTIDYEDGPFMPENIEDTSLSVSAVSGTSVTLTVSSTVDTFTKLLLHMDGTDGSTTFTDDVGNIVTVGGSAQIDTAQSVFGGASGLFSSATSDYLTVPDSADWFFGTGDFTINFRVRFSSLAGTQNIIGQRVDTNNRWQVTMNAGTTFGFFANSGGVTAADYSITVSLVADTWYDVEIDRNGTNFYFFLDGVSKTLTVNTAIGANSIPNLATPLAISGTFTPTPGSSGINGWFDEMRVSTGIARHTAGFTSPTSAFSLSTATGDFIFSPLHIGALFKLRHYVEGQTATTAFTSATTGSSIRCFTTWRVISHGTWTGRFKIEKSTDAGVTWTTLRVFTSVNDFNANTSGTEDVETNPVPFLIRINMYSYTSGTANIDLTSDPFYQEGVVRVTAFLTTRTVTATVLSEVGSTAVTIMWSEGSWSDYRGWPSVARFFQDRLVYACTDTEPQTLWMTVTGDYYSFFRHQTLLDTDGITVQLPSRQLNAINGLIAFKKLLAFTSSSAWSVGPVSGTALTPTSVQQDVEEYSGSANIAQVVIGTEALYGEFGGEVVHNIGYQLANDGFIGSEVNILAKHFFEGYTITKMAYQRKPNSIVWCLRSDGVLLSLTYMKEQEVVAWTKCTTDGVVKSIAVIPGDNSDELWAVIERDNGMFIESMEGRKQHSLTNHVFLDSYVAYSAATTTLSSLEHLANETVAIIGDDVVQADQVVSASGTITMPVDPYLSLLLHFEGVDAATSTVDSEPTPKIISFFGNAQIDTAQYMLGTSSLLLDGTGDYITTPDSSAFNFAVGDFSIEFGIRFNTLTNAQTIMGQYADGSNNWYVRKVSNASGNKLSIQFRSAGVVTGSYEMTSSWSVSAATWYRIQFTRSGNNCYLLINGVLQTLTTSLAFSSTVVGDVSSVLYIGQAGDGTEYVDAWIDELRISKGIARNTAAYTVATIPFNYGLYSTVYAGLGYNSDLETLNIDFPLRTGTLQGSQVKVGNVTFRFINTRGGYIGPNSSGLYEAFDYATLNTANLYQYGTTLGVSSNFSGDVRIALGAGYEKGGRIFYRQSDPLPVSIGAIMPEVAAGGQTGG